MQSHPRWLLRGLGGAAALCLAGWTGAQTPAPTPDSRMAPAAVVQPAPPPASSASPAVVPPAAATPPAQGKSPGKASSATRHYRSPAEYEAAAARAEQRRGQLGRNDPGADGMQRNALTRCEAFKEPWEREACEGRVRAPGQGSVDGGGMLREYSHPVPAQ